MSMNEFETIRIRGYRRLMDVVVQMRSPTVVIGANGAGKTSFLESWWLLAESCQARLNKALIELGGLGDIVTRDKRQMLDLDVSMRTADYEPLEYHVQVEPQQQSYKIAQETLRQQRDKPTPFKHIEAFYANVHYYDVDGGGLVRPNWEYNLFETALSQVPKMFREPETLRSRLGSLASYKPLDTALRAPIRLPQQVWPAPSPGLAGENLISCLYYLREADRDRFEMIEDTLAAAFPESFERLDFPPVAAGVLSMTWKDKNYSRPMYMHQLSEGTLRFLWLITLLQSHDLSAVTLIDEPELSLHPELLSLLADLMREASKRTLLIVATQSDGLVRFLKPTEVLVADVEDGVTTLTWGDSMNLDKWLAEYTLDEVWRMGRLGGRL